MERLRHWSSGESTIGMLRHAHWEEPKLVLESVLSPKPAQERLVLFCHVPRHKKVVLFPKPEQERLVFICHVPRHWKVSSFLSQHSKSWSSFVMLPVTKVGPWKCTSETNISWKSRKMWKYESWLLLFFFFSSPPPPYYEHSFGKSQRSFLLIFFFKWLAFEFDVSSGNKALESRFSTTLAHNIICIILVWDSKILNLL